MSCLFPGAGRAVGPRAKLCQQAVDRTALLITGSAVLALTQLTAAALPVIIIILKIPVKKVLKSLELVTLSAQRGICVSQQPTTAEEMEIMVS